MNFGLKTVTVIVNGQFDRVGLPPPIITSVCAWTPSVLLSWQLRRRLASPARVATSGCAAAELAPFKSDSDSYSKPRLRGDSDNRSRLRWLLK